MPSAMELTWAKTLLHCNKEIATVIENSMTSSLYEWFLKSIVEAARPPEVLMLSGKQPFIFMRFSYLCEVGESARQRT